MKGFKDSKGDFIFYFPVELDRGNREFMPFWKSSSYLVLPFHKRMTSSSLPYQKPMFLLEEVGSRIRVSEVPR